MISIAPFLIYSDNFHYLTAKSVLASTFKPETNAYYLPTVINWFVFSFRSGVGRASSTSSHRDWIKERLTQSYQWSFANNNNHYDYDDTMSVMCAPL